MTVKDEDKLFYFERNFFTLDGLWIIETEAATDRETALAIDLAVWQRLLPIVFWRIIKYLGIEKLDASSIVDVLAFRWACEGWKFDVVERGPSRARVI